MLQTLFSSSMRAKLLTHLFNCKVESGLRQTRSANETASRFQVRVKTIETHCIMNESTIHSAAELTKYAICAGLTSTKL